MTAVRYEAVFFDAIGTLFRLTPPHVIFSQVMTRVGHPISEVDAESLLRRANNWWLDPGRQLGRTAGEELAERRHYVRLVLEDYGRPDDTELSTHLVEEAYWARWVRPNVDSWPTLATLSGKARLALLSNGGPSVLDAVRHVGLASFFEQMSAGLEVGVQKPDPGAFLSAAARLGVSPEHSLLVDDTPEHVAGAEAVGMRGVLLDREDAYAGWEGERIGNLERLLRILGIYEETVEPIV
ncbi:MAG: HAD family hydrolase [Chloroflexota bacterium]|nr:HAD family hydrolase [Chloroflexota bacterium]